MPTRLRTTVEIRSSEDNSMKLSEVMNAKSEKYIILEVYQVPNSFTFVCSIEERWTEYYHNKRPTRHSVILDEKEFHFGEFDRNNTVPRYIRQLVKLANSICGKAAEDVLFSIFYELVFQPELDRCLNDVDHEPGFLQTWVPKYLKLYVDMHMRDREEKIRDVQDA